jgi:hypothetical protein
MNLLWYRFQHFIIFVLGLLTLNEVIIESDDVVFWIVVGTQ